ncbi:MAG: uridine kinase [Legionellales bacterium]|nr:uridine kinase [Legionellales bacterium]
MDTKPFVFGIAGASGSGKSLLVSNVASEFTDGTVAVLREDSYYLDQSHLTAVERSRINYDHPSTFEHGLMVQQLRKLCDNQPIETPIYDYKSHTRSPKTALLKPARVVLVDGILILTQEELREFFDVMIFIDAPLDACLIRRIQRDIKERARSLDSIINQYQSSVRPMYWKYVYPSRDHADLVVTGGGNNWKAIDLIVNKIHRLIE